MKNQKILQPDAVIVQNLISLRDNMLVNSSKLNTNEQVMLLKINSCLYRDAQGNLAREATNLEKTCTN